MVKYIVGVNKSTIKWQTNHLPSGKLSPFYSWVNPLYISMVIFNSFLYVYQRVYVDEIGMLEYMLIIYVGIMLGCEMLIL